MGLEKSGFDDKILAMVKIGPRHWNTVPNMSICGMLAVSSVECNSRNADHLSEPEIHR
jgi:hypothetical protein